MPAEFLNTPTNPSAWEPSCRSLVAGLIWKTFSSGSLSGWIGGMIRHPAPLDSDPPLMPEFPHASDGNRNPPEWVRSLLTVLDSALPEKERLFSVLDADSLTLKTAAPAFRIPACPSATDAAHCLVSARVLAACAEDLLPPIFVGPERAAGWMAHISAMAIMLGGEQAFLLALRTLRNPATFATNEEAGDIGTIEME